MTPFALGLTPPYYAVIFSNQLSGDTEGYHAMGELMHGIALEQDGCLGVETVRGADGFGITVSYWRDEQAIRAWKAHARHKAAQQAGMARWYDHYELRVARVERAYAGPEGRSL